MEDIVLSDPNYPHMNQHEIVLKLVEIQNGIKQLNKTLLLNNQEKNALIDGLTAQVNYLQDKVKILEHDLSNITGSKQVTVVPAESVSDVNPIVDVQVQG